MDEEQTNPSPDAPVRWVYVHFSGLERVSPQCMMPECRVLQYADTIGKVQAALNHTHNLLKELDVFKSIDTEAVAEPSGVVNVIFKVVEKKRSFTVGTNFDRKGEALCDMQFVQPAVFGGPLTLVGSVSTSARREREFNLRFATPRFLGQRLTSSFDLSRAVVDEAVTSSYLENITNGVFKLTDSRGLHTLSLEAALRDLLPTASSMRLPSVKVQQARLRTVKTSLKYAFNWKPLHSWQAATPLLAGARSILELAGFPGNVKFLRSETHLDVSCALPLQCTWRTIGTCGLLLSPDGQPTCLQDRFHLGGAGGVGDLKGYAPRGVGPCASCLPPQVAKKTPIRTVDALGGDTVGALCTSIYSPLFPMGGGLGAHLFGFVGLGSLLQRLEAPCLSEGIRTGARASFGCGMSFPISSQGSINLTYACPIWATPRDVQQKWQMGFQMDLRV